MGTRENRGKAARSNTRKGRVLAWLESHQGAASCIVAAACLTALCAIFYFVVFSDFGASADFVYNQF